MKTPDPRRMVTIKLWAETKAGLAELARQDHESMVRIMDLLVRIELNRRKAQQTAETEETNRE